LCTVVHFLADLFARLQAHDHELGMLAGEQHLPEVVFFKVWLSIGPA
jgi:hypothetical protein